MKAVTQPQMRTAGALPCDLAQSATAMQTTVTGTKTLGIAGNAKSEAVITPHRSAMEKE
ncbi:MAG TPA: hypothetical protein VFQ72_00865 [Candidatus Paceibacterota bacterium]|nr:hypothetical protein [Candidatus Paceibacterota bacterium]